MALKFDNPSGKVSSQSTNGDLTLAGNGTGAVVVEGRLGVGTDSPISVVHVYGSAPTLTVQDDNDPSSYLQIKDRSDTWASIEKVSGSGDVLLDFNPQPANGTGVARARFFRETNTTGVAGISVFVGANSSQTNAHIGAKDFDTYVCIHTGNFGVKSSSFGTSSIGVVSIGNGTAPTSSPANSVQLYAKDVSSSSELFVRDEAGNQTQLSPHAAGSLEEAFPGADDKEIPLPIVIHHRNDYLGCEEWIHLSKLARLFEQMTGEQIIYRQATPPKDWDKDQKEAEQNQAEKISQWQANKSKWEASHNTPYDEEPPTAYVPAEMPRWMRERTAQRQS